MAGAQFHLMVKSEADVNIHVKEIDSQDPLKLLVQYRGLLNYIY